MKLSKDDLLLYAITDRRNLDKKVFFEKIEEALQGGVTLDAVNVCADCAINSLLELTGERAATAVVDEVFSRFCVGK